MLELTSWFIVVPDDPGYPEGDRDSTEDEDTSAIRQYRWAYDCNGNEENGRECSIADWIWVICVVVPALIILFFYIICICCGCCTALLSAPYVCCCCLVAGASLEEERQNQVQTEGIQVQQKWSSREEIK